MAGVTFHMSALQQNVIAFFRHTRSFMRLTPPGLYSLRERSKIVNVTVFT